MRRLVALGAVAVLGACGSPAPAGGEVPATSSATMDAHPSELVGAWRFESGERFYDRAALMPDGRFYGYRDISIDMQHWSIDDAGRLVIDGMIFALAEVGSPPSELRLSTMAGAEVLAFDGAQCDFGIDCVGAPTAPTIATCVAGNVLRTQCMKHGCAQACTPSFLGCARNADCPPEDTCVPLCPPHAPGDATACDALGSYCVPSE